MRTWNQNALSPLTSVCFIFGGSDREIVPFWVKLPVPSLMLARGSSVHSLSPLEYSQTNVGGKTFTLSLTVASGFEKTSRLPRTNATPTFCISPNGRNDVVHTNDTA